MTAEIDRGAHLFQEAFALDRCDTFGSCSAKLSVVAEVSMERLADTILRDGVQAGEASTAPSGSYDKRPSPDYYELDLDHYTLFEIDRRVRAYGELGCVYFRPQGERVFVSRSQLFEAVVHRGGARVVSAGFGGSVTVSDGTQVLRLSQLSSDRDFSVDDIVLGRLLVEAFHGGLGR